MKILITGGAGFVGSSLAFLLKENDPQSKIVVLDNLKRRGSELNLPHFKNSGIEFIHGDIRNPSDFLSIGGDFDLFIEASAEPSVLAGTTGDTNYLFDTNLRGTYNCLEYARNNCHSLVFLSTSRVYSIPDLLAIPLTEGDTRLEIDPQKDLVPGLSKNGISENFSTTRYRSLYGATKLASELLIQEYCATFNLNGVINRCGVIAGPRQWGKTDQGVFTLWVANHFFEKPLRYTGFGGLGKQVRDLLHPFDLYTLIMKQLPLLEQYSGEVFNIGGGLNNSVSLFEYTQLCQEITGKEIAIGSEPTANKVDIPYYVTDTALTQKVFDWQPQKSVHTIVSDIHGWLRDNSEQLKEIF